MTSYIGAKGERVENGADQRSESDWRSSNCSPRAMPWGEAALSTFEEERREALASVLDSLGREAADPDRRAACFELLQHLTRVSVHR
jgi:hypothetical protein